MDDMHAMCRRLRELLERDELEMSAYLKGDIFEEYKKLLEEECHTLENVERNLRQV